MPRANTFVEYCSRLSNRLRQEEWSAAEEAVLDFSLRDEHVECECLFVSDINPGQLRRYFSEGWPSVVALHLHVINALHAGDRQKAYTLQTQLVMTFCKDVVRKVSGDNWFLPLLDQFCSDLRWTARAADATKTSSGARNDERHGGGMEEHTSSHEKSAEPIMECYRACVADGKSEIQFSKRLAILNLTNQLFRIYFTINKLNLCKPLIRQIGNSEQLWPHFSIADRVTFKYYIGRKAMFDSQLKEAEAALTFAWRNCPSVYHRNRRAILMYLVPVKMFLGQMPNMKLLQHYNLNQFADVACAVRSGNLRALEMALEKHERFFIHSGIFLMLEKLKIITCRTLFKKVHTIFNKHQIPLQAFEVALKFMGVDDCDRDEAACLTANLIAQGRIKGYISHQHQVLVVSKVNPFPAV